MGAECLETGPRWFIRHAATAGRRGCPLTAIRTVGLVVASVLHKDSLSSLLIQATVLSCYVMGRRVRAAAQLQEWIRYFPALGELPYLRDKALHRDHN